MACNTSFWIDVFVDLFDILLDYINFYLVDILPIETFGLVFNSQPLRGSQPPAAMMKKDDLQ